MLHDHYWRSVVEFEESLSHTRIFRDRIIGNNKLLNDIIIKIHEKDTSYT